MKGYMTLIRGEYLIRRQRGLCKIEKLDYWPGTKLINIGSVSIPKQYRGKKIKFKIEIKNEK